MPRIMCIETLSVHCPADIIPVETTSMNLTLNPQISELIESEVKSGRFATAEEVVAAGVVAITQGGDDIEKLDPATLAALDRAFEQSARGEGRPWEQVRAEWTEKYLSK
jgi:Arc/MetJ-type ribon-helix-helix transcriptional regulator